MAVVVEAVVVVATVVVVGPAVVVAAVVVVGGTGLAATVTVEPRSTSTVPGATDELTCIMTAPERYFITYKAWATSMRVVEHERLTDVGRVRCPWSRC